ncbi:SMF2 [Candida oxycetoniae]|uniref:SMF2 n=1 Tax=Candida oxycetoniae TaxID=497107 RepID=A0AAI9SYM8_9ASCO|nr:SMF2 [Candida oxycetoniae]KAI3405412.2 SMF2 [Candida oxycetoniae]
MTEIAIIATDLAEVIGTAIALNILFNIPLFLGVIITVIDVLIVLSAYRPKGPLFFIRIFESFVSILVAATVVCFGIQLYQVSHDKSINFSIAEVFRGFLPNEDVVDMSEREGGSGLFLSLAILGATVMPHSLYLGSGLVQARLKDFDIKHGYFVPWSSESNKSEISIPSEITVTDVDNIETPLTMPTIAPNPAFESGSGSSGRGSGSSGSSNSNANGDCGDDITLRANEEEEEEEEDHYRPSIHAIKDTMSYTIIELVISLFTVALFVNSAILIVAGATLNSSKMGSPRDNDDHHDIDHDTDDDSDDDYENADLFTIYHLLSKHLSPTAGFVFALALLCSGQSAGVVCTLAGQMVSEGFLSWSLPPVARRLVTRGLAIVPCLFTVTFAGREGLAKTLNASQVVLSMLLPIVSAPLIWFTCDKKTMRVPIFVRDGEEDIDILYDADEEVEDICFSSSPGGTKRYTTSDSAIRLQDLRNSHPCAGWEEEDDDEEDHHRQLQNKYADESGRLMSDNSLVSYKYPQLHQSSSMKTKKNLVDKPSDLSVSSASDDSQTPSRRNVDNENGNDNGDSDDNERFRIKGYKDFSNSLLTSVCAIVIWGFITVLNLYLVVNMSLDI